MSATDALEKSLPGSSQPRNPISRARFERIAGRSVSAFGLVFGLQTFPSALGQLHSLKEPWGITVVVTIFAGLAIIPILAIIQWGVKFAMGGLALLFLAVIMTWPLLALDPDAIGEKPWVWFL